VAGDEGERSARTLGEKIEWLVQYMWPADAPPPRTHADVAEAISKATGEEMSSTSIWKLRTGRGDNPTLKTLTALATFFGVPIGYFGEGKESKSVQEQVVLLALLKEKGISAAALRSLAELSPGTRQMVTDMIESATRVERGGPSKDQES
jgi:transcriptional regulator with XRE-family HTH domain